MGVAVVADAVCAGGLMRMGSAALGASSSSSSVSSSSCVQRMGGSGARRVALPCAFLNSEVHASSSSLVFSKGNSLLNRTSTPVRRHRKEGLAVRGLFGLGVPEIAVIAGVVALVFGPKQLPKIGKNLGQTVRSFQQAAKEFESEVSKSKDSLAEEVESDKSDPSPSETITSTPIANSTKSEKDSL